MNIGKLVMKHQSISLFIIVILVYILFRFLGTSFEIAALASWIIGTHMASSYERFRIYKAISSYAHNTKGK